MAGKREFARNLASARVKVAKLDRLARDAAATPAEAANAREKIAALQANYIPPPLPKTLEEMFAHRAAAIAARKAKYAARKAARNAAQNPKRIAKHNDNETDNALKLENARLRARVAELEGQLARETKRNETKPKGNIGRPCKGDRPMTAYERLKAFRARQRMQ